MFILTLFAADISLFYSLKGLKKAPNILWSWAYIESRSRLFPP